MIRVTFNLLVVVLLFGGCKVRDLARAQKYVEKDLGKATFIYQDVGDDYYNILWYIHEMDTLVDISHDGNLEISSSKFVRTEELEDAAALVRLKRARGELKVDLPTESGNPTEPKQEKKKKDNTWEEW